MGKTKEDSEKDSEKKASETVKSILWKKRLSHEVSNKKYKIDDKTDMYQLKGDQTLLKLLLRKNTDQQINKCLADTAHFKQ